MFSPRYVRLVVVLVFGAVAVEFFHRQTLAIAIEPLKAELALSDTQVGSLVAAFALAYGLFALVIGRLGDRGSRRGVLAGSIALWSAATLASGLAAGFPAFLATRLAVGAGQAANGSAAQSLLADYVGPGRRATALALVSSGATLGTVVALGLGGLWTERYGWRSTFVWAGGVGLVFAAAFGALVREPPRGWSEGRSDAGGAQPTLGEVLRALWALRSFRQLVTASTLVSMAVMSAAQWGPAFFQRVHGMGVGESGMALSAVALSGTVGTVAGGVLCDRRGRRDPRAYLVLPAWGCWLGGPLFGAAFLSGSAGLAIALATLGMLFALAYGAPIGAVVQALAPLRMRSLAAGVLSAFLVLVGMGAGPQLVGIASDRLEPWLGGDSLRIALAATALLYLWAGVHFAIGARTLAGELRNASAS